MTWHTQAGDRHLKGAEARLFRNALRAVLESIENDTPEFDHTFLAQQNSESLFQLFVYVGMHLLRPTEEWASLNAWTEGAVGVVFRQLYSEVQCEIDSEDDLGEFSHHWRKMIDAALAETEPPTGVDDNLDDHEFGEAEEYEIRIHVLKGRVLWDDDWEVDDDDMPTRVKKSLGIPNRYFDWSLTSTMPKDEAIQALGDLCGFRRGEFEGIEVE